MKLKEFKEMVKQGIYPKEVVGDIDKRGYEFLAEQGIKRTARASVSAKARSNVESQLLDLDQSLEICHQWEKEALVVFFVLRDNKTKEIVAKSKGARYGIRES